jgi:hypothetical protein
MRKKNMRTIFVLAALLLVLAVSAFALPDNPPSCYLSTNTYNTQSSATLTASGIDSLANAGMATIRIYENNQQISYDHCGYLTSCVSVKSVSHSTPGTRTYHAVCQDKSGQQTKSSSVSVTFAGQSNHKPVITSSSPSTPYYMNEDQTVQLKITATDADNDKLSYSWTVNGATVPGVTGPSYRFSKSVSTDTQYTIAVVVSDGKSFTTHAWWVTVRDAEPSITSFTSAGGPTECDTFTFPHNIDSHDPITTYAWDWGDGSKAVSMFPSDGSHQYKEQGTYTVRLTITDSDGDSTFATTTVTVTDVSPTVDAGPDDTIAEGTSASFSATVSMPCPALSSQAQTLTRQPTHTQRMASTLSP